jgi:broad specificity phosphatase PhoE
MPLTVVGVRHGEVHNPAGVIYAGLDGYGLSDLGRSQATAVGEALRGAPVAALYASPLDRGMQTAQAIADVIGADITADIRLHEWRYWQQWAGLTWEELRTKGRAAWEAYQSDPGSVTEGESLAALADRMDSWLSDVRRDHREGFVVAVTHLEPLRATLLRALDRPAIDLFQLQIGLGQAVRLHPDPDPVPFDPEGLRHVVTSLGL